MDIVIGLLIDKVSLLSLCRPAHLGDEYFA